MILDILSKKKVLIKRKITFIYLIKKQPNLIKKPISTDSGSSIRQYSY